MGKIIMCGSFKGGVGKSVTTFNLAYSLAEIGKKVLAVDFDSQAKLTTCFGVEDALDDRGIFYNKSEVWISEERLYEVLYSFDVPDIEEAMEV